MMAIIEGFLMVLVIAFSVIFIAGFIMATHELFSIDKYRSKDWEDNWEEDDDDEDYRF